MPPRFDFDKNAEPLYLMDGSAFIFRSFYAYRNMTRSDGFPTNALFMVARLIMKLLREQRAAYFGFVMDGRGPNFRHERFAAYKAHRPPTPEALVRQLDPLRELLGLLGVSVVVSDGCEADDCIASLAERNRVERSIVILGADKDLRQCLRSNVLLWDPAAKNEKITTLEDFRAETGFEPSSWPDYQALVGDSSDNIPGLPGVGEKTAVELIRNFRTLEELFDRLSAVPPKVRPKLEGQRDNAMMYRDLTRLRLDDCPAVQKGDLAVKPVMLDSALHFMDKYELRALARELESMSRAGLLGPGARGKADNGAPLPTRAPAVNASPGRGSASRPVASGMNAGRASGPQPVPCPPASRSAAEQGSLFAAACKPEFISTDNVDELPLDADRLALLLVEDLDGVLVAGKNGQRLYTGPVSELAQALDRGVALVVTPDYKKLVTEHPELTVPGPARWFDLSVAAYLLSPEDRGYSFSQITARFAERAGGDINPQSDPGGMALALGGFLAGQMAGDNLLPVFNTLEMPLVTVLAAMEQRGIAVDHKAFSEFLDDVQSELEALTHRIHELAGRTFNIRSSQQLADVLFETLQLPKAGKTKGGVASTSQEALEKLSGKHPVIEALLEFRKLEKLRSTYLEPLPRLADSSGRIHTSFNQTATATGRLSSSNPNLQNIPVRGELGARMRACFVAGPGYSIVSADYSQIELRVLAHLSGDPTLVEAFRNNEDIHSRTAGLLFDVAAADVTPAMRRNAKTINFGLIYGMGAQKLAQDLGMSLKEAKTFIERYFERLAKLKSFYDSVEQEAKENGYVATMAGRRRFTPEILSENNQLRSQAKRQAINTRIQGSAADIIKIAMLAVEHDAKLKQLGARQLLQVHDELLLEAPPDAARTVGERLAELMNAVRPGGEALSVPLVVEWGVGRSWADAH